MKFAFSEQQESAPSDPEESGRSEPGKEGTRSRERKPADEELEHLKEDAHVYGWEFDEVRGVFRPLSAL